MKGGTLIKIRSVKLSFEKLIFSSYSPASWLLLEMAYQKTNMTRVMRK